MEATKEYNELKEWLVLFLQHKNIFQKKIVKIEEKEGFVIVEYKDHLHYFAILPNITNVSFLDSYKDKHISIITYNTKDNLNTLISEWSKLAEFSMLSVYFVNPHSNTDKKWIIYPFTHHRISEHGALKLGLQTLFESVEEYRC